MKKAKPNVRTPKWQIILIGLQIEGNIKLLDIDMYDRIRLVPLDTLVFRKITLQTYKIG